jgi:NADH-quinone oxidoreductase subunit D
MQNQILLFFSKFINRLSTRNNSNIDLILNFGPQHPAAHGVLRLVIKLNGEYIMGIDPHIGFLHRGTEKLAEQHSYLTNVVFIDRLDYTSVLTQTHAYALAIESGVSYINSNITLNVRTIFDELSRILNHLLALATHALDIGTMSILF